MFMCDTRQQSMKTYIACLGAKNSFEFTGQLVRLFDTIAREQSHYMCVIFPRIWETASSDIAVTHCFDFENSTVLGRFVTATWIMISKNVESPEYDTRTARNATELTTQNKVSREAGKLELVREQRTMP